MFVALTLDDEMDGIIFLLTPPPNVLGNDEYDTVSLFLLSEGSVLLDNDNEVADTVSCLATLILSVLFVSCDCVVVIMASSVRTLWLETVELDNEVFGLII